KLQLSRKGSMDRPEIHTITSGTAVNVPEGLWYMRVESEKGVSLITSFRVIKEVAPEIIRPISMDEVSILEGQNTEILLQWKGDERLKYLIEWKNPEAKQVEVGGSSALINIDPSQPFSWRVKIQDAGRPEALWTSW